MSPRRTTLALGLITLSLASTARAGATPSEPPASGSAPGPAAGPPARFAFLDAPPPLPAPDAPPPASEPDEHARRSWEFFPEAGIGAPFCRGAVSGGGHCGDSGSGPVLGGGALYRFTPYVALGAAVSFASFHIDGVPGPAFSRASFFGFSVRGYFAERGAVDPYVEAGFGRGAASVGYADGAARVAIDGAGPAATAAAGIDFWVMPYLKLGPALSYRWTWLTDARTCVGGACETGSVADLGAVGSYASLSFVATVAMGREM